MTDDPRCALTLAAIHRRSPWVASAVARATTPHLPEYGSEARALLVEQDARLLAKLLGYRRYNRACRRAA